MERVGGEFGLSAIVIIAFTALLARVTVVAPVTPAAAFMPLAAPIKPPSPEATLLSMCSVRPVRLAFVHPEKLAVLFPSGPSPASAITIRVSATAVVTLGKDTEVSDVFSTSVAMTSHGFPVWIAPRNAIILASW